MPKYINSATHMAQKLRYNKRARKHAYNKHERWSLVDITLVLKHTVTDRELSKNLGRSIQAIHAVRNRNITKGGKYV